MPYLGNEPAVAYTSTTKDSFSGDGSTTDFTMSKSANVNAVRVVVENVVQNPTVAYTCSGTTISFTSAPPTGTSNIYVVHLGPPAATVAPPTTINNATTFTGGVTFKNGSPEDTDGGRESILTFKGVQSGEEESTLAQIQAAHDGSSDDEKGLISFKTNDGNDSNSPTERWRITSDGHLKAMVNGYGIDFSASETGTTTVTSSILDDYEEGEYTYTVTGDSSGSWTARSGYTTLSYTKIGRMVTVTGQFETLGTKTASGQAQISLPFTCASGGKFGSSGTLPLRNNGSTVAGTKYAFLSNNSAFFYIANIADDGSLSLMDDSNLDASFEFKLSITYFTS
jgi:hypothetical protein